MGERKGENVLERMANLAHGALEREIHPPECGAAGIGERSMRENR